MQNHTEIDKTKMVSETAADLCAALRVTPQTITRMEREGRIPPAIRIGRRKLWPAGTVARLMAPDQAGGAA